MISSPVLTPPGTSLPNRIAFGNLATLRTFTGNRFRQHDRAPLFARPPPCLFSTCDTRPHASPFFLLLLSFFVFSCIGSLRHWPSSLGRANRCHSQSATPAYLTLGNFFVLFSCQFCYRPTLVVSLVLAQTKSTSQNPSSKGCKQRPEDQHA